MKYVFVWVDNKTKKLWWEWLQAKQLLVIFNPLTLSRRFRCRGGRQGWPTRWGRHTCSHSYRVEYQRSSDHTSPLPRPVWPPCYGVVCMTEVSLVSSSWVYLAQPGLANNFCKLSNMSAVCCPAIFWLKLTSNTGDTNEILKLYRWQWSLVSHSIKWIVCFILFPYQNNYIYDSVDRIVIVSDQNICRSGCLLGPSLDVETVQYSLHDPSWSAASSLSSPTQSCSQTNQTTRQTQTDQYQLKSGFLSLKHF